MPQKGAFRFEIRAQPGPIVDKTAELLKRHLKERGGVDAVEAAPGETPQLTLDVQARVGTEGFAIEDGPAGGARIVGNDERGLLYGMGKFLRTSRFSGGGFVPGTWRGASVPQRPVRGMYFATHFHNFYHDAPVWQVQRYVEELSLWGLNALMVWFDMHHFNGIDDPHAREMIERLRAILQAAKGVGMRVGLCVLANEAYADSPEWMRADGRTGRAHYGVELCPHIPGAQALMLQWFDEEFQAFADIGLDQIWIWPYDQGGCACERCRPWGANGFLVMAEAIAELFRKRFADGKVILSTWLFDFQKDEGEWRGLTHTFARPPKWLDYILIDSHTDFPSYPLTHGVPGGLPALNFPEISMWAMYPWGGYGANPLPARFQWLWNKSRHILSGGFPYSEGIFEDINKAVMSQFYWNGEANAADAVREYIAYEYSPDAVADIWRAIEILEQNHPRHPARADDGAPRLARDENGEEHCVFTFQNDDSGAAECNELLESVKRRLPSYVRSSWRWRILLLRARIDHELRMSGGVATPRCEEAFAELTEIYHAEDAQAQVAPPGQETIRRLCGR